MTTRHTSQTTTHPQRALRRFAALAALPCLAGCGATFAPPARADLDFAGARLEDHRVEASGQVQAGSGLMQGTVRAAMTAQDHIEAVGTLHDRPGDDNFFAMGGLGYRRMLLDPGQPLQLGLGFGIGVGAGGHREDWGDAHRVAVAVAPWVDLGLSLRVLDWLTLYTGGRMQKSVEKGNDNSRDNEVDPVDRRLPPTEWLQAGGGVRFDVGNFFGHLDAQLAGYDNNLDYDFGPLFSAGVGVRWGGPPPPAPGKRSALSPSAEPQ